MSIDWIGIAGTHGLIVSVCGGHADPRAFWYCDLRISCAPPVMKPRKWVKHLGVGSNKTFKVAHLRSGSDVGQLPYGYI